MKSKKHGAAIYQNLNNCSFRWRRSIRSIISKNQIILSQKFIAELDKGMAVSIGRLRECALLDYKFVLLSHNTIRGAAGGAILNAELAHKKGII